MPIGTLRFAACTFAYLCIVGFTNPQAAATQGEEDKIHQSLTVLRAAETVDAAAVGYAGEQTPTYKAFLVLGKHASDKQLIDLLDDPNTVIATYAFWELSDRLDHEAIFPLLMEQLKRENPVQMFVGSTLYESSVGDVALDMVELTGKKQELVTDYLLTTDNRLSARSTLLQSLGIPKKYYKRIQTLAKKGEPHALVALARFKREQDIDLILSGLKDHPFYALRAITCFPHERFLPALAEYQKTLLPEQHWSTTQREFYAAVSKYRDPLALTILETPLDSELTIPMRSYHIQFIKDAIAAEASRYHNGLRKQLNVARVD